jgi:hypothetical protein
MAEVSHQNQESAEVKKRNKKNLLLVGGTVFILVAIITIIIIGLFYFHVLRIGNIVTGD